MKLRDAYQIIRRNMKKNRSRTFMTVFAAAIGCAFLIVLASFAYGVQKGVVESIMGERVLNQVMVHGRETMVDGETRSRPMTAPDIADLRKIDGVNAVTWVLWLRQAPAVKFASYEGMAGPVTVDFSAEEASGRELHAGRMPEEPGEVMVGYHFNDILKEDGNIENADAASPELTDLLGREVTLQFRQFFDEEEKFKTITVKIVGISDAPSREWQRDQALYISKALLEQIEQFTQTRHGQILDPGTPQETREHFALDSEEPRYYEQVYLYAHRVQDVKAISEALQEQGFFVYSVVNEIEQVNFYFLIFKLGLIFVGTIAVIIASIGIYNTMTMAVTERSQEIGIMKAVGAHPRVIKRLFLMESAYIGIFGALVGVAVAYVVSSGVNLGLPVLFDMAFNETVPGWFRFSYIPASLVVISFVICVGIAAISGLRPAAKATQVDVLRALRRDL